MPRTVRYVCDRTDVGPKGVQHETEAYSQGQQSSSPFTALVTSGPCIVVRRVRAEKGTVETGVW